MKKLVILTLVLSMVLGFGFIVSAVEVTTGSITHEFGVDLRTRFISQQGFTGDKDVASFDKAQFSQDTAAQFNFLSAMGWIPLVGLNMEAVDDDPIGDLGYLDLRTRFNYNAMFDKNLLKFVTQVDIYGVSELSGEKDIGITDRNSSEFDSGTDEIDAELINLSAEYNPYWQRGKINFKLGWRPSELCKGLIANREGVFQAQAVVRAMDFLFLALSYQRGDGFGVGPTRDESGMDTFTFKPALYLSRTNYIAPFWSYARARGEEAEKIEFMHFSDLLDKMDMHQVGIEINFEKEKFDFWFVGAKQFGEARLTDSDNVRGLEFAGYLPSAGESADFDGLSLSLGGRIKPNSVFDIHGEFIYSTGEPTSSNDPAGLNDNKLSQFIALSGASHPWAEIMGLGMFGNQYSLGSPGDEISNLVAYNLGIVVKPLEKLSVTLDYWYAELKEEDGSGNTELGTEVDLKIGYEIIKDLKLDIVVAHLWAGDATSINGESTEDPSEIGMQLTYTF